MSFYPNTASAERSQQGRPAGRPPASGPGRPAPAAGVVNIRGNEYELAWSRIAKARARWPRLRIESELVNLTETFAAARVTVILIGEDGTEWSRSTAHAQCASSEFDRYLEKAETAAMARALRLLGIGE